MRKIIITVKLPLNVLAVSKVYEWKKGKRILIRVADGRIHIGTVNANSEANIYITLDNSDKIRICQNSTNILGNGINRKRKSSIPDDELYMWKNELSSDSMRNINKGKL